MRPVLPDSLKHAFTTPCCQFNGNKLLLLQRWVNSSSCFKEQSAGGRLETCTTRNLVIQTKGGISDTGKEHCIKERNEGFSTGLGMAVVKISKEVLCVCVCVCVCARACAQRCACRGTNRQQHESNESETEQDPVRLLGTEAFLCLPFLIYRK